VKLPPAILRRQSLRFRIVATFVLSAIVLAGVLSTATLLTVRRFLEDQRVRSSTRQTLFAVLFAREYLASSSDLSGLASNLRIRQDFDAMVTRRDQWYSTGLELTPEVLPGGLRTLVSSERVAYEIASRNGGRVLVYGAPLPPPGVNLYLFFDMEDIDRTVSLLARVLAVSGCAIVVIAAVSARRVSVGILNPLSAVSAATQRMAEGLLETRVETVSADEVGQLATSFNRMADALHDLIQRERFFVAAVSHELRTPLAALNAAADVLARHREVLPESGREAVDLLAEDLVSLRQLVSDLMEISELDSHRIVVREEEVGLRTFVEALLTRRHLEAVVTGPDLRVTTDKSRLERIIGNLVDNAFTHGDGSEVSIRVFEGDGSCGITVTDRGPGVEASELPLLFDRFYKPDRSRTRERGGVGLGLALARENARVLGGTLEVTSAPGAGASFTLKLERLPDRDDA
jgi:two-component system, OmpR family, sensor histidine kinase MtrB